MYDLSNIKRTEYEDLFLLGMAETSRAIENAMMVANAVDGQGATLQLSSSFGTGGFSVQVPGEDPVAQDRSSMRSSMTRATPIKHDRLTIADLLDNPTELDNIVAEHIHGAQSYISSLVWTLIAALPTTAHPGYATAGFTAVGGSTAFFVDDFAGPQAQNNTGTTALSNAAVSAARAVLERWLHPNGDPYMLPQDSSDYVLAVSPSLLQTAYDMVNVAPGVVSDTGYNRGMQIATAHWALDANDWLLVNKHRKPINLWVRRQPELAITIFRKHVEVTTDFDAAVALSTSEAGTYFSTVEP